jgi:hypothetical protein
MELEVIVPLVLQVLNINTYHAFGLAHVGVELKTNKSPTLLSLQSVYLMQMEKKTSVCGVHNESSKTVQFERLQCWYY